MTDWEVFQEQLNTEKKLALTAWDPFIVELERSKVTYLQDSQVRESVALLFETTRKQILDFDLWDENTKSNILWLSNRLIAEIYPRIIKQSNVEIMTAPVSLGKHGSIIAYSQMFSHTVMLLDKKHLQENSINGLDADAEYYTHLYESFVRPLKLSVGRLFENPVTTYYIYVPFFFVIIADEKGNPIMGCKTRYGKYTKA